MKVLVVIPSRMGSTRLPGKPLRTILGKTMIRRVYEGVRSGRVDDVVVATDSEEIVREVRSFGGKAVMTSAYHKTGTDRVCEAVELFGGDYDIIVNVQGDEPLIRGEDIDLLVDLFRDDPAAMVATPVTPADAEEVLDPNKVKVVTAMNGDAIYFSRSPVPYARGEKCVYLKHVGVYAFRREFLLDFKDWPQTPLEKSEMLEQLRVLENGYKIKTVIWDTFLQGVDTEEDIVSVEDFLKGADE